MKRNCTIQLAQLAKTFITVIIGVGTPPTQIPLPKQIHRALETRSPRLSQSLRASKSVRIKRRSVAAGVLIHLISPRCKLIDPRWEEGGPHARVRAQKGQADLSHGPASAAGLGHVPRDRLRNWKRPPRNCLPLGSCRTRGATLHNAENLTRCVSTSAS